MHAVSWAIVLSVVNIPLYAVVGRMFFSTVEEFRNAARFRPTPGFALLFRGEYWKDWRAEVKLALFMVTCAALVYLEYLGIQALVRR